MGYLNMNIIYGICLLIAVVGTYLIATSDVIKRYNFKIVIGLLLLIGSISTFFIMTEHSISSESSNAVKVAVIDDEIIYQNCDTGEYFYLISNDWNIFQLHTRQYINSEDAEQLIKAEKILDKIG